MSMEATTDESNSLEIVITNMISKGADTLMFAHISRHGVSMEEEKYTAVVKNAFSLAHATMVIANPQCETFADLSQAFAKAIIHLANEISQGRTSL